jgi:peptide/nickel transport system ATP-binding protein
MRRSRSRCCLLIRELQRELDLGVIFVTHDIGVAVEVSDRVGVMYAGKLVELAGVEQMVDAPRHPYSRGLLASTVHGGMRGQAPRGDPRRAARPRRAAGSLQLRAALQVRRAEVPRRRTAAGQRGRWPSGALRRKD